MRINKSKIAILSTLVAISLQGCDNGSSIRAKQPLVVTSYTVPEATITRVRNFKGQVVPTELTTLSFRIDGKLEPILVKPGQFVTKGELLAKLDSSKIHQKLTDAEVQYQLSEKQLKRGKNLLNKSMVSQSEFDSLVANRNIAKANYQLAKNKLEYTRLLAPFDGYISESPKKSYETVYPGETVVSIFQGDMVQVKLQISDSIISVLDSEEATSNLTAQASFFNDSNTYQMEYFQHSTEPDPLNQSYELWFQMEQIDPAILPGSSVSLTVNMDNFSVDDRVAYEVPYDTLEAGSKPDKFNVWKIVNTKVTPFPVQVLHATTNGVVITSGIKTGDVLVSSQLNKMREGVVVTTSEDKPQ